MPIYTYDDYGFNANGDEGGVRIDDLYDVNITSPSTGQVLTYDSGTNEWINTTPTISSGSVAAAISAAAVAVPNNTDEVATNDGGVLKKITWANVKAFFKTYFDTLYTASNVAITGATKTKITYDSKGLVTAGADATTSDIPEGSNLYWTNARTLSSVLTGFVASGSTIVSTDTVLQALGKAQSQINSVLGGVSYQATWNASTNSPSLASGVGTKGYYYVVSVDGATNLDGITDWKLGDWAIYNGTAWEKVDNTDAVISVNGLTGIINLTTANISDSTNKRYVTDADLVDIGNLSGTNTGDNAVNTLYSGLVSNATHTGEVTGSTALTLDKTAITNKTLVTKDNADYVLISDTSDSGNLKKVLASDFSGGAFAAQIVTTNPVSPTNGDGWIFQNSISTGMAMGTLGMTYANNILLNDYQLRFKTADGIKTLQLN